jgi:hypothetical protein
MRRRTDTLTARLGWLVVLGVLTLALLMGGIQLLPLFFRGPEEAAVAQAVADTTRTLVGILALLGLAYGVVFLGVLLGELRGLFLGGEP